MTARADAIAYVELHADTTSTPALTTAEVEGLVDRCALADSAGTAPGADGWQATYWHARAVQRALELRAVRAGTITDMATDGTTITGSQLAVALNREAARWGRRAAGGTR